MDNRRDRLHAHLAEHGQEHLLAFWDELGADQRARLVEQIDRLDLKALKALAQSTTAAEDWAELARRAHSPPAFRLERPRAAHCAGAGRRPWAASAGRGSRRRDPGRRRAGDPAGVRASQGHVLDRSGLGRHAVSDPARKDRRPVAGRRDADSAVPDDQPRHARRDARRSWRPTNTSACRTTTSACSARARCRRSTPQTGRLLLAEKHELALSPDGHGGMLAALERTGCLADMRRRGLRQLFYCQVDNPLVSMCDPEFLGYHLLTSSELSTQVVAKRTTRDKVGNVVSIDGKLRIIEYSDLNPWTMRSSSVARPTARRFFGPATRRSTCSRWHCWSARPQGGTALPFHVARKAVPHVDPSGRKVEPSGPNAVKFERFIFDLLPEARQVDRRRSGRVADVCAGEERAGRSPRHARERAAADDRLARRLAARGGLRGRSGRGGRDQSAVSPRMPRKSRPRFDRD